MQTFLPFADFTVSAGVLDSKRLGKQRVETLQVMKALLIGGGWSNHPVTRMWRGHEYALLEYQQAVCKEWARRGYRDTCLDKTTLLVLEHHVPFTDLPPWLGDEALHRSHRSNLLRKDPVHYGFHFTGEPDDLEYVWPV